MRVLLIHNPKSGDDDHAGEHLVEWATAAGHEVTYFRTKDAWKSGLNGSPDLVAVAGGDGTVAEVAKTTAGRGLPLTILPTGTANNIARALGLAGMTHQALIAEWARGTLRPFDLGVASGPWGRKTFLESVGIGALAELMIEIDHGDSGYVNELEAREQRVEAAIDVLLRIVGGFPGVHGEVDIDGQRVAGDFLLVEVLNFGAAGPNLRLAPNADGGDGWLDVVLIGASAHDRNSLARHLRQPDDELRLSGVWQIRHGKRVRLKCDPLPLHLDDELVRSDGGGTEPVEMVAEIEPGALSFLVPGR